MNRTVLDDHSSLTIIDRFIYAPGFIFGPLNVIMCILFTMLCLSDRERFHPNFCILRIHLIIAFYINAITHIIITTVIFIEGLVLPVNNYTLWFISAVLGGGVSTEILRFLWISIFIERCVATFYSDVYENQVKRFIWLPIMLTIFIYTAAIFASYLEFFCAFIPGYAIYSLFLCFDSVGVILIYVLHRLNKQKRRLTNDSDVKLTQRYQIVENIKVLKIIFPIFTTGVFFTLFGTIIRILTTQIQPLTFLFRYSIVLYYVSLNIFELIALVLWIKKDENYQRKLSSFYKRLFCTKTNDQTTINNNFVLTNVEGKAVCMEQNAAAHFSTLDLIWKRSASRN